MKRAWFDFRRERRSKPFLLLEIGMVNIRLHAVDASKAPVSVSLLQRESVFPGDVSALIEAAKTVLESASEIRDLAIVINSPSVHHHIISIPPMNPAEREKIVGLEMKRLTPPGEGAVVSFWPAGKVKENGSIKEYVLCASMPSALTEALIAAAREKKFNLIGFTSHPQLASHLLKECRLDNVSNTALVEVNENEGSITLFHSNAWNMERQFLLGSGVLPEIETPPALDADKLRLEVGRALQYFKQQVRNENISQIFLYGDTGQQDQIRSLLEASFRIPVVPLALDLKKFAVQNSPGDTSNPVKLLTIPYTAALYSHFETYIDFLPREWRIQKQLKIRKIAVIASAAALYVLLAGIGYLFRQEAAQIEKREHSGILTRPISAGSSAMMQEIQNSRTFALAAEQSSHWIHRRHHVLAGFARELAGAMPPEMHLIGLEATEKKDVWLVKIEAEICSPNGSRSQELFLQFQEQMRMQTSLKSLAWSEIQLGDALSAPSAEGQETGSNMRNTLNFSLKGSIAINSKS
jgi:hypothetical protein